MLIARILIVIATIKVPLSKAAVYKWSSTGEQIKTDWRAASDEKHRGTGIVRHFGKKSLFFLRWRGKGEGDTTSMSLIRVHPPGDWLSLA